MKKIGVVLLIICFLFANSAMTVRADPTGESVGEDSSISNGSHSLDALNPMLGSEKMVDNMRSAIVYETKSETLLYAWNPDTQMYPASLVKILTALVAIENGNLDDVVTVSQAAVDSIPHDAVSSDLLAGEKLTLEELLYCLLLDSANDAAIVIAEHISGSHNEFVTLLNESAAALGCASSHFTNAHGLHDDNQHTTARDCAKILNAAISNPQFKAIFTANEYTIPKTNLSSERKLSSNNSMKDSGSSNYYDPRVKGGRTGVTQDGRRCLATVAEHNGMLVVVVVMGSQSVYQEDGYSAISIGGFKETTQLLDACLTGYKAAQVLYKDQVLRQVKVEGADSFLLMGPNISVSTILPESINASDLTYIFHDLPLSGPVHKGQYVADVQIWNASTCVAQAQLFSMNGLNGENDTPVLEKPSAKEPMHPMVWILIILLLFVVLVYLVIRFWGRIKFAIIKMRGKRYRHSHKRMR